MHFLYAVWHIWAKRQLQSKVAVSGRTQRLGVLGSTNGEKLKWKGKLKCCPSEVRIHYVFLCTTLSQGKTKAVPNWKEGFLKAQKTSVPGTILKSLSGNSSVASSDKHANLTVTSPLQLYRHWGTGTCSRSLNERKNWNWDWNEKSDSRQTSNKARHTKAGFPSFYRKKTNKNSLRQQSMQS